MGPGLTALTRMREVRLDVARERLLQSGARVGAVAVGFESPAHFTREFKRRFGVSPSRSLQALPARTARLA
jgi:AraC-like DNA-binding protein